MFIREDKVIIWKETSVEKHKNDDETVMMTKSNKDKGKKKAI